MKMSLVGKQSVTEIKVSDTCLKRRMSASIVFSIGLGTQSTVVTANLSLILWPEASTLDTGRDSAVPGFPQCSVIRTKFTPGPQN